MVHIVLAEFLEEFSGMLSPIFFVVQTIFKFIFIGQAFTVVLLELAYDVINFSPGWGFGKPGNFNVRDQAVGREVDIDLQAFITHDALLLSEKPVQEFWSKKETSLSCDLVRCGHNLEMKAVDCFDDKVTDLLVV